MASSYFFNATFSVRVNLDNVTVLCRSTVDCDGDELGLMTARECCVENETGLAYTFPDQDTCLVCIGEYRACHGISNL